MADDVTTLWGRGSGAVNWAPGLGSVWDWTGDGNGRPDNCSIDFGPSACVTDEIPLWQALVRFGDVAGGDSMG